LGVPVLTVFFDSGYYVTVLTIEKLGRKFIQIQGFLAAGLFCAFSRACVFSTLTVLIGSGDPCWKILYSQQCGLYRVFCVLTSKSKTGRVELQHY
jgi:hypothetical protein